MPSSNHSRPTTDKKIFYATIKLDSISIPSVNEMYHPKSSPGKAYAWMYKDHSVAKYQDKIIELANKTELSKVKDIKNSVYCIDVVLIFLVKSGLWTRDVSNMIKATEDALMSVTGVDDSRHVKITSYKALSPNVSEYVIAMYEVEFK